MPAALTISCQQVLVLEPSIKMAYFTVSNKVLATEPFSGASGHYTGEDDREGLSIKLRASQSLKGHCSQCSGVNKAAQVPP